MIEKKVVGKIVFIDGEDKYITGKELEDYEASRKSEESENNFYFVLSPATKAKRYKETGQI